LNASSVALAACAVLALASGSAGALAPVATRARVAGALCSLSGVAGAVAGIVVLAGGARARVLWPEILPLAGLRFELDPLAALFVVVAGALIAVVAVYGVGYVHGNGALESRSFQATFPLFCLTLILVPVAASVSTLLACWELMALTSLLLVAAEHRRSRAARDAAVWYGVMTHLGFVVLLIAFALFAGDVGGESFAAMRAGAGDLSSSVSSTIFVLAVIGFGSKAGMVPFHVWLPRAHPEAPSHVSALMSAAMVSLGIYGIVRVGIDLLGGGPRWWGLVVLALGAVSAVFGILHALVSSDLKRLLAYSTTENMGLVLIGVGAALLFAADGRQVLATVALSAALLHVVTHAAAKGLLFCGAGAVLHGTGTRDLDRLGGLMRRMPVTGAMFTVGALAIAALPPLSGFVSEWALLQSLVNGGSTDGQVLSVLLPLGVAVIALTTGLAAATFVKALGVGFLALPRSPEAEHAHDPAASMRVAMIILAGFCALLAFVPWFAFEAVGRAASGVGSPLQLVDGTTVRLAGITTEISPLLIACWLVIGMVVVVAGLRLVHGRRRARLAENWGCGRVLQTARMEYTATSFAEPLERVFDDVLRPDRDVDVSHAAESRYFVEAIRYHSETQDAFERHLYEPMVHGLSVWGRFARKLQNGDVLRYLAYAFGALVVLLVVAR
jgi:formate hydrogenlyase subunit 3/multisubunit Na+/H+ antiporter MnhD subunit